MKVVLLQYYKDKYNKARSPLDGDTTDDGDDNTAVVANIIASYAANYKIIIVTAILNVFKNNYQLIRWNACGDITQPKCVKSTTLNLSSLIRLLVHKSVGSPEEITLATDIVRPLYKRLKHYIDNKKYKIS